MSNTLALGALTALCLSLVACGEKPQTVSAAKPSHAPAYEGTTDGFSAGGWKAGDKDSWTDQIHTRNQTQNEYVRMMPVTPTK